MFLYIMQKTHLKIIKKEIKHISGWWTLKCEIGSLSPSPQPSPAQCSEVAAPRALLPLLFCSLPQPLQLLWQRAILGQLSLGGSVPSDGGGGVARDNRAVWKAFQSPHLEHCELFIFFDQVIRNNLTSSDTPYALDSGAPEKLWLGPRLGAAKPCHQSWTTHLDDRLPAIEALLTCVPYWGQPEETMWAPPVGEEARGNVPWGGWGGELSLELPSPSEATYSNPAEMVRYGLEVAAWWCAKGTWVHPPALYHGRDTLLQKAFLPRGIQNNSQTARKVMLRMVSSKGGESKQSGHPWVTGQRCRWTDGHSAKKEKEKAKEVPV